jgi:hypothetical protein
LDAEGAGRPSVLFDKSDDVWRVTSRVPVLTGGSRRLRIDLLAALEGGDRPHVAGGPAGEALCSHRHPAPRMRTLVDRRHKFLVSILKIDSGGRSGSSAPSSR